LSGRQARRIEGEGFRVAMFTKDAACSIKKSSLFCSVFQAKQGFVRPKKSTIIF
jgi:hypothetical protein